MYSFAVMNHSVDAAKSEFLRAKDRIVRALETTPDDRINWSPSMTARTAIDQVAHVALSIPGIQGWLSGEPFPFKDVQELDTFSRTQEESFLTRESVLSLLEENSQGYLEWLDSLTEEQLASTVSMGPRAFPMMEAISFPADHTRGHAAQMDYMQTIYGDLDWHMG